MDISIIRWYRWYNDVHGPFESHIKGSKGPRVGGALFNTDCVDINHVYNRLPLYLQTLNPVPYPAQTANAIAWIAYSYVIVPVNKSGSALLFWVNELGVLFGLFFTLSCYGPARTKAKDRILAISLFFAFVIPLIGAVGVLTEMSTDDLKLMWGFTANGILLMYYGAQLSTIVTVFKTKSSKTLNLPLSIMQTINGCLWLGYGVAVSDPFIYVPNAIGACTGGLLCFLLFIFREKRLTRYDVECGKSDEDGEATSEEDLKKQSDGESPGHSEVT